MKRSKDFPQPRGPKSKYLQGNSGCCRSPWRSDKRMKTSPRNTKSTQPIPSTLKRLLGSCIGVKTGSRTSVEMSASERSMKQTSDRSLMLRRRSPADVGEFGSSLKQ